MGSPINDPHPNEVVAEKDPETLQEPEDFFGENEEPAKALEPREPGDDSPIEPGELPADASATLVEPVAADELLSPEDFAEPAEEPEADVDEPDEADEPEAEPDDTDEQDEEDETGNKREYVVLQEVVLDQEILNELSKAIKSGEPPMVALIEVHRVRVTNPKSALNGAWRRHKSDWVDPPRLAVVTANKIRARKAKPRVREVIGFEFE